MAERKERADHAQHQEEEDLERKGQSVHAARQRALLGIVVVVGDRFLQPGLRAAALLYRRQAGLVSERRRSEAEAARLGCGRGLKQSVALAAPDEVDEAQTATADDAHIVERLPDGQSLAGLGVAAASLGLARIGGECAWGDVPDGAERALVEPACDEPGGRRQDREPGCKSEAAEPHVAPIEIGEGGGGHIEGRKSDKPEGREEEEVVAVVGCEREPALRPELESQGSGLGQEGEPQEREHDEHEVTRAGEHRSAPLDQGHADSGESAAVHCETLTRAYRGRNFLSISVTRVPSGMGGWF